MVHTDDRCQPIDVEFAGKDTNGTGDGQGRCEDLVCAGRDVISTACGDVAHGCDDGFCLGELSELAKDDVAANGAAAGTVDSEHDSAYAVVMADSFERFDHGFTAGQDISGKRRLAGAAFND